MRLSQPSSLRSATPFRPSHNPHLLLPLEAGGVLSLESVLDLREEGLSPLLHVLDLEAVDVLLLDGGEGLAEPDEARPEPLRVGGGGTVPGVLDALRRGKREETKEGGIHGR